MSTVVEVRRHHAWALLPQKMHVDRKAAREEASYLDASFRYHRAFRRPETCAPWVMGQELGWQVCAPVTIEFGPFRDAQVGPDEDLPTVGRLLELTEFWQRGDGYIATEHTNWLRSHQFRGVDGAWQAMFVPNGHGTVEWHLGWGLRIPEDYLLLVTSLDECDGLAIPTGVLTDRQVNRSWDSAGISVALRPTETVRLQRGQPFARMVLLHRDSLQVKLEEVT